MITTAKNVRFCLKPSTDAAAFTQAAAAQAIFARPRAQPFVSIIDPDTIEMRRTSAHLGTD